MFPFSLFLGLSAGLGLAWSAWQVSRKRAGEVASVGYGMLLCALVGGRAAYVLVNWPYYQLYLGEIPQVWLGGFSGLGALGAAALLTLFYRRPVFNTLLPLLAALAITGVWGIPMRQEAGNEAFLRLCLDTLSVPEEVCVRAAPAVATVLTLAWFVPLNHSIQRKPALFAHAASLGLLAVALTLLLISFLRVDPMPVWHGLRLDTWGAGGIALIAVLRYTLTSFDFLRQAQNASAQAR